MFHPWLHSLLLFVQLATVVYLAHVAVRVFCWMSDGAWKHKDEDKD